MKIIGIDPGLERCGFGVLAQNGSQISTVAYGCLYTLKNQETSVRLAELFEQMTALLKKYSPQALAIEDLFFNTNAKTVMMIGQAKGVIMLAAQKAKIPVVSYPPLEIKMALTGYGRADKGQIQQMVKKILHLSSLPKPDDTADALAVALTYCLVNKFKSRLKNI